VGRGWWEGFLGRARIGLFNEDLSLQRKRRRRRRTFGGSRVVMAGVT